MSQMSEATPSVFTKRDMLALQDQQNGNYASNQIVLDTSQLANSNKYMAYRDAYLTVPMILAATSLPIAAASPADGTSSALPGPETLGTSADFGFGLKNWFGSIVHSMILDYSGTTIIQQTPLSGLWNCFVLNTTMSLGDLETIGSSIGFYPDDVNFVYRSTANAGLIKGITNTFNTVAQGSLVDQHAGGHQFSNKGMFERQNRMLTSEDGATGSGLGSAVSDILTASDMGRLYTSQVISRKDPVDATAANDLKAGCIVYAIQAQIYLKHLHSFFSQIPLLKGVFFRLTLNINNIVMDLKQSTSGSWDMAQSSITSPLGGVNPILLASSATSSASAGPTTSLIDSTGVKCRGNTFDGSIKPVQTNGSTVTSMRVTLNVGKTVIDTVQKSTLTTANADSSSSLSSSCILNVPAYTFNPSFEEAYLSQPVKTIMYSDIFQYTTPSVDTSGAAFNFLITNGISNIKSVLVIPMLKNIGASATASGTESLPPFQSPFDTCGGGTTAPYAALNNFNVVVAGQNMVYNQVQYDYQQFEDQLRGVNSVNGGLVDGLTSGLIDFHKFQRMYRYYYINCARMLPIDEAVPKSVSISGTSLSKLPITFYVFIEYGVQVSVDCLTGARV
jgi:hypothetical protein